MFVSKFTFEKHIYSILSSFVKKIDPLRKPCMIFGDQDVLLKYFNFILPCSPVLSFAADSHLKLLNRNL